MSDELEPQFDPPSIVTDGDTLTLVASEETLATGNGAGHQDSQSAYQSLDVGPQFAIGDVVLAEPQGWAECDDGPVFSKNTGTPSLASFL